MPDQGHDPRYYKHRSADGALQWWTVTVTPDIGGAAESISYRTQAKTWEQALADISALFPPED